MQAKVSRVESVYAEKRIFEPPGDFVRKAYIKSREAYEKLYRRSMEDPQNFWAEMADEYLEWFKKWDGAVEEYSFKDNIYLRYFVGGKLNAAYNCLDRHLKTWRKNKAALIWQGEPEEDLRTYRRQEIFGKHISWIYVKGIQEARHIMDLLQRSEKAENYEMEVKSKAGDVIAISTSIFLLRDGDNRIIGTAGIFKNITEQKRLEAELRTAQANLVEASKMRALGELVSGVAHELNNPLMASQTILHVIFNNLHEDCPNRERLELIRRCNDRIQKIVEHLKEFSRQEQPAFQGLDINQPIENALLITGQQLLDHNISLVKRLAEDLPEILGDSNQLEQVFLNLIANALDAMDSIEGQKELTIASDFDNKKDSPVVVSIKDTGVGIPQENLDKIFEPFFSTKPVGRGNGLGLSLCFGIIEAHGGRLEVSSQPGKGSEVKVILPVGISGKE
jgi:PAS domain S-box-containing protein